MHRSGSLYFSNNGGVYFNSLHSNAQMYRLYRHTSNCANVQADLLYFTYNRNLLSNNKSVGIPQCRRVSQRRSYIDSCSRLDRDQEEGIVQSTSTWRLPENKNASSDSHERLEIFCISRWPYICFISVTC